MRRLALALALALGACDPGFESEEIVLDLRILGLTASPPEIVTPFDPAAPGLISPDELGETELCGLIADPGASRRLAYRFTACPPENDGRCRSDQPSLALGEGALDDPDEAASPAVPCATLAGSAGLLAILAESVRADDLAGFGNVSVMVELEIWPEGEAEAAGERGHKAMRYAPSVPVGRVANTNPTLDAIHVARGATGARGDDFDLPLGRCGAIEPFPIRPGEQVQLVPDERADAREAYVVPTFDGGVRNLTETLTYQYYATAGDWTRFRAGGPRDAAGVRSPIDSKWTAPDDAAEVQLWIVVRDERGGQAWYESCARVTP